MSFKMLLLPPFGDRPPPEKFIGEDWPEKIARVVPGAVVKIFERPGDARADIVDADAAYGMVTPELLPLAKKLRWIAAPGSGLGRNWYYDALIASDIVVTSMRGIQNEHLATHIMAFVLAFARGFDHYLPLQQKRIWRTDRNMMGLSGKTAVIVGVGGAGAETARLCAAFGMRVTGVDPRVTEAPPGVELLVTPDRLDEQLGNADFVILTVPESPATLGMFNARRFAAMRRGSYFINIGRGGCAVIDDLVAALGSGHLAGAGLDVMAPEPLPESHPLWTMPGVLITPHVAVYGAPNQEGREALLLENCRRFVAGEPLVNPVDKKNWF